MVVFSVVAVVISLVATAFVVRHGNEALRRQHAENVKEDRLAKWREVQVYNDELFDVMEELQKWRDCNVLRVSDNGWSFLVKVHNKNPEAVEDLLDFIVFKNRDLEENHKKKPVSVFSPEELSAFERSKSTDPDRDPTPRGGVMQTTLAY